MICTSHQVLLGRSNGVQTGGALGTYRGENVHAYGYRVLIGKPPGKITFGRPRHGWQVILKWVLKNQDIGLNRINVAPDGDKQRALVDMSVNFRLYKIREIPSSLTPGAYVPPSMSATKFHTQRLLTLQATLANDQLTCLLTDLLDSPLNFTQPSCLCC